MGCWLGHGMGSSSGGQGPRGPGAGGLEVSPLPHYRHFSLPAPSGCPAGPRAELQVRGALGSHPASPQTYGAQGGPVTCVPDAGSGVQGFPPQTQGPGPLFPSFMH